MVRGLIGEIAILGGALDRSALATGKETVPLACVFPNRHVHGDSHHSAWLHLRFNTYRCSCGVHLLAKELAQVLGVEWPIKLPRTLSAEKVWEQLAMVDFASKRYLEARGLGGVLLLPEVHEIVRFNTGKTGDMAVDNLAWAKYRIACAVRTIHAPSMIQSVQLRMAGPNGQRSKTMNLRGCPVRGGAFIAPCLFDAMDWPSAVVIVEGMADFFAACIRGWPTIGMPGVEFARSLAEAVAPLVDDRDVYLAPHRDEPGERAAQTIVDVLSARSSARLCYVDFREDVKDLADDLAAELAGGGL